MEHAINNPMADRVDPLTGDPLPEAAALQSISASSQASPTPFEPDVLEAMAIEDLLSLLKTICGAKT